MSTVVAHNSRVTAYPAESFVDGHVAYSFTGLSEEKISTLMLLSGG